MVLVAPKHPWRLALSAATLVLLLTALLLGRKEWTPLSGSAEFRAEAAKHYDPQDQAAPAVVFHTGNLAEVQEVRAWSLQIRKVGGGVVREVFGGILPRQGIAWDGLATDGSFLPPGTECQAFLSLNAAGQGYQVFRTVFRMGQLEEDRLMENPQPRGADCS